MLLQLLLDSTHCACDTLQPMLRDVGVSDARFLAVRSGMLSQADKNSGAGKQAAQELPCPSLERG